MRISDWSSDVCSSDLPAIANPEAKPSTQVSKPVASKPAVRKPAENKAATTVASKSTPWWISSGNGRSEEHTSELQSLMRISYAVFCLKKKTHSKTRPDAYSTYQQISEPT